MLDSAGVEHVASLSEWLRAQSMSQHGSRLNAAIRVWKLLGTIWNTLRCAGCFPGGNRAEGPTERVKARERKRETPPRFAHSCAQRLATIHEAIRTTKGSSAMASHFERLNNNRTLDLIQYATAAIRAPRRPRCRRCLHQLCCDDWLQSRHNSRLRSHKPCGQMTPGAAIQCAETGVANASSKMPRKSAHERCRPSASSLESDAVVCLGT